MDRGLQKKPSMAYTPVERALLTKARDSQVAAIAAIVENDRNDKQITFDKTSSTAAGNEDTNRQVRNGADVKTPLRTLSVVASNSETKRPSWDRKFSNRQDTVRYNWDIVLSALKTKRGTEINEESIVETGLVTNQPAYYGTLQSTDKENWMYFSIIVLVVVVISFLFCFIVYKFFPSKFNG